MPKKVVKLCKEQHYFRRSMLKQAKRGHFDICFKFKVGKPILYMEGALLRPI